MNCIAEICNVCNVLADMNIDEYVYALCYQKYLTVLGAKDKIISNQCSTTYANVYFFFW